jgi:alanine dehydrogenase
VRYLTNADVAELIDPRAAIVAMRAGYDDYRRRVAEQIPRADLISRTGGSIHRLGVMAGSSRQLDLAVVRIKSDVVSWSASGREEKYAGQPGLFAGIVLAFRLSDGAPVAILQDGLLQHIRVGAAAAIATDILAARDTPEVALLGSGGMAEAFLDSIVLVRDIRRVRVYSPDTGRRESFAARLAARLGIEVRPVGSAREAVDGVPLVLSATNSLRPPFEASWLARGAHVTMVSRREVGADLLIRADLIACLGASSYPAAGIPRMHLTRGGAAAFLALTPDEEGMLPPLEPGDEPTELPLFEQDLPWAERPVGALTALVAVGTQGVQFAAIVGAILRAAESRDAGQRLPDGWLLQDIRS